MQSWKKATLVLFFALQILIPIRFYISSSTDTRFSWLMFSGRWRFCEVRLNLLSKGVVQKSVFLDDPKETASYYLNQLIPVYCSQGYEVTIATCENEGEYLNELKKMQSKGQLCQ